MQESYIIPLVPCKNRTGQYVMICMTSYMILVWNQGSGDPGYWFLSGFFKFRLFFEKLFPNFKIDLEFCMRTKKAIKSQLLIVNS